MKPIKILIFLSLIFGSYAVYSQESNTEIKKTELEKKTEVTDQEKNVANQQQLLKAVEVNPATAKPLTDAQRQNLKEDEVFVKTRPYPSELDASKLEQSKSKDTPVITTDNRSGTLYTPANPDPDKK